jgi:hypothetical protein
MTPVQTPWWQNPVVWTTYALHAIAIFFLVSPLVLNYPGVPAAVVTAIGAITLILNQLGYQAHSATVRSAELAAVAATMPWQGLPVSLAPPAPVPPAPAPYQWTGPEPIAPPAPAPAPSPAPVLGASTTFPPTNT